MSSDRGYSDLLRDKTVALVGGHDQVDWDRVNSCDFVVRLNDHWLRQRGRVDILYSSCASDVNHRSIFEDDFCSQIKYMQLNRFHMFFSWTAGDFLLMSKFWRGS